MENNYKKRLASQNLVFGTLICSLLGINTVLEIVHSTEDDNPDEHVHNERTYEPSKINRGDSLFILTQEDIERIVEHVRPLTEKLFGKGTKAIFMFLKRNI